MFTKIKDTIKKNKLLCLLELITFILIIVTGIIFKQPFLRVLPLCISLVNMFLQANVNRYAFLLGSANTMLYAASYFSMTLYVSAAYALFFSFPFQLITFFTWNKKTNDSVTELKRLSKPKLILMLLACAVLWGVMFVVFSMFDSSYIVLDNTQAILGILATVLCLFRFSEYTFFMILSGINGTVMYATMLHEMPGQITYLIYNIYSIACMLIGYINMKKNNIKTVV